MKHTLFPAILFAVALGSCSKNDPNVGNNSVDYNGDDIIGINVYTGTTRGDDTITSTIEDSEYVLLHIYENGGSSYTSEFKYDASVVDWAQSADSKITWSSISFPAAFFSLHDGEDPLEMVTFDGDEAIFNDYTVTGDSSAHLDLVYHASELTAMPGGGVVSVYHKHALSKIHLYASTGTTKVAIARVRLVEIDGKGTVTITPIDGSSDATAKGVSWECSGDTFEDYQYYSVGDDAPSLITSADGSNPIINTSEKAPLMIIPQECVAATVASTADGVATFANSYVEVIYYMVDSNGTAVVGYAAVSDLIDAEEYIAADQTKTLYVMAAFPLGYEFEANKEYDIALGLGVDGSSGGLLVADYYVDKNGDAVTLTKDGVDLDGDGDSDEDDGTKVDIPSIEAGDPILSSSDDIDIVVTANSWDYGDSTYVDYDEE